MRRELCLLPTLLLCGCTALFQPPWYVPPPPPGQVATTLNECLAQATRSQPINQGLLGMVLGGSTGAALGAVIGGFAAGPVGAAAGWGALAGGVAGGGIGLVQGQQEQEAEYQACRDRFPPASTPQTPPPAQP